MCHICAVLYHTLGLIEIYYMHDIWENDFEPWLDIDKDW